MATVTATAVAVTAAANVSATPTCSTSNTTPWRPLLQLPRRRCCHRHHRP
jgi:hypothetical protein